MPASTPDPNDLAAIMAKAEEQHRRDMNVLREALQIAKRLNGGSGASSPPANPEGSGNAPSNGVRQRRKPQGNADRPAAYGLTDMTREAIKESPAEFTIRTLAEYIKAKRADLAEANHFMVGISSILARELKRGGIALVTRGSAGKPSVYRKGA